MLNSEINEKEVECLQSFLFIRNNLARELEMTELEISGLVPFSKHDSEEMSTHELLIAEVIIDYIYMLVVYTSIPPIYIYL